MEFSGNHQYYQLAGKLIISLVISHQTNVILSFQIFTKDLETDGPKKSLPRKSFGKDQQLF